MKRKTLLASLAAGVLVALGLGGPVYATPDTDEPEPVCATWQARGATGTYPDVTFGGKPAGTEISKSTAKLTKPEGVDPGVEFASKDLGVGPLEQEAHVRVEYATSGGASTAAGAIRMFGYEDKNADTLNDAPDFKAVAESESGVLLFTAPAGKKLGTLGLVFDASNNTQGAVTFSGMTIGERPVSFTACPSVPETTKPTTTSPAAPKDCEAYVYTGTTRNLCADFPGNADRSCTDVKYQVTLKNNNRDPWDLDGLSGGTRGVIGLGCESNPRKPGGSSSSSSSAPVGGGAADDGGLPVTGPSIGVVAFGAAILIGTGILLTALVRRRKVKFTV